jgi:hypothetical protein
MDGSLLKCLSRTGQICASIFGHKPGLEELSEHRGSFLLTFIAPRIPKNDSSSTALEAVSQPINGCAAQVEGQMLMSEG